MNRLQRISLIISFLATATLCHAQTVVSGEVTTTTWTKAAAPYVVTGAITVPTGNTLTIEAGVDVYFDADVRFDVWGALHVHGTEADSVRFIPGEATEWGSLRLLGGDSSSLAYARISGGHAEGDQYTAWGGGLRAYGEGTRVAASHCVVSHNRAARCGGGISVERGSVLHLMDSRVSDNQSVVCGGGIIIGRATAVVSGCTISRNRLWSDVSLRLSGAGGGVFAVVSDVAIEDCAIIENAAEDGGGVSATNPASLALIRCIVSGNVAQRRGGGLYAYGGGTSLTNCVIARNSAGETWQNGLAVYGFSASVTLLGCTVYGNGSTDDRLIVRCSATNCIIWNEGVDSPSPFSAEGVFLSYCCVSGMSYLSDLLMERYGSISSDPLFTDPANGDYSLQPGSPCINTGDPSMTDPDGSRSDMGAIPYTGPVSVTDSRPVRFALGQNLPNPFNPVTTVPYTITEAGLVTLSVYNLQGQLVRTLVQEVVQPGEHHAIWDGRDFAGRATASGIYVYRLTSPEGELARRMSLLR